MTKFAIILPVALAMAQAAGAVAIADLKDIHGSYAPGGDCSRQPQVRVDRSGVHAETPAGKAGPLPVQVSLTYIGGASYDGIQNWVLVKMGRDRWGDVGTPVLMTFNHAEKPGHLLVERLDDVAGGIPAPLAAVARAGTFRRCGTAMTGLSPASAAPAAAQTASGRAVLAATPAAGFGQLIHALTPPSTLPANSFQNWRDIERAPRVTWAALPPESLDKPLPGNHYFRRNGVMQGDGGPVRLMAAGARTMVMTHYLKNEGRPLGEASLIEGLAAAGIRATLVRCPIRPSQAVPRWYRLDTPGKRTSFLWYAPARGAAQPWEGYQLILEQALPPPSARDRLGYTDKCS